MGNLLEVLVESVAALSAERAVSVVRAILRAECAYARLGPTSLTVSSRISVADGGIDAEVDVPTDAAVPDDCLFRIGLTGIQIKSGTSFKPWTANSIRAELLDSRGNLYSEVQRLADRGGRYVLVCTGHDLTPQQRNQSRDQIASVLADAGYPNYEAFIEVLGASQITEFAERYPGTASLLTLDTIAEGWVVDEWRRDEHMATAFVASREQAEVIGKIREGLQGHVKHIRLLGEPGLGKTRIVLESTRDENIAPYVLYIPHGSEFGRTKLFRQLLREGYDKPLVLVIDELPESELFEIWRHLKPRCNFLRLITLDHGRDESYDADIERIVAPRLPDETIKRILMNRIGESRELDRWASICEGSPRVAHAVADNLIANPNDLLRPPSTVALWSRFIHGYDRRDDATSRQVDCVTQHLALFSRFGYEAPVNNEALYIAGLVQKADPTIGWARFQEIVQGLRARRVIQGSRTLFFVPKALHIYLWKQFWQQYGRGFDFDRVFVDMPESLHAWFMSMFRFAGESAATSVVTDILRTDGTFSRRATLTSAQGSRFLSILAEANPGAVLRLLEAALASWADQDFLEFKQDRQNLVWALEKIAVWPALTVRSMNLLARFATNENSDYSNNATGTFIGLFHIGPESAATESTPQARLPALLRLLRAPTNAERRLGLKALGAALDRGNLGFRTVGPEYQGMRERAKLWTPTTYGEWRAAKLRYFQALVDETRQWPASLRAEVCEALLGAVRAQILTPACTELAFRVLAELVDDEAMPPRLLNRYFWHWREYEDDGNRPDITSRLRDIERSYTQKNLVSRFQRYVVDVDHIEWDDSFRARHDKSRTHAKALVDGLAQRIAKTPDVFNQLADRIVAADSPALLYFGERLAAWDTSRRLLLPLVELALKNKVPIYVYGYLSTIQRADPEFYRATLTAFLEAQHTAWLGAVIAFQAEYDDDLFARVLHVHQRNWIDPNVFSLLRYGKALEAIPRHRLKDLMQQLCDQDTVMSRSVLLDFFDSLPFTTDSPFTPDFVSRVLTKSIRDDDGHGVMQAFRWKTVCLKLTSWDEQIAIPMLDVLFSAMGREYRIAHDASIAPLTHELSRRDPSGAWNLIKRHFEATLPAWRHDLLHWLKGGVSSFDRRLSSGVAELPVEEILAWVEEDSETRATLIAHAVPPTLDDEQGGRLTREILHRYSDVDGVQSGIRATFHSGSWSGPTSAYLKRKRERFRTWLAAGFESEVMQWIETEIEDLDRQIEREEISEERSWFN